MCRFLLYKATEPTDPRMILSAFSAMAKKSKAFDGDWQGDGWGFSYLDSNHNWQLYRSLKPIWEDVQSFNQLNIKTNIFAVHARSATFPEHKGNIEFNQPYVNNESIFVFNGHLKGVTLSIPGRIGAEKIWSLLQKALKEKKPVDALEKVKNLLKKNTKKIQALNIGYTDGKNIYALSYYTDHPEYYRLHVLKNRKISIIVSEPFGNYAFHETTSGTILSF